jgi:hypothetical protein
MRRRHSARRGDGNFIFIIFRARPRARERASEARVIRIRNRGSLTRASAIRVSSIVVIVVRLEIFALSKSARFFFGYWSDRAGRAL